MHSNGKPGGVSHVTENGRNAGAIEGDNILLDEKQGPVTPDGCESEKCKTWIEWLKTPFFYKVIPITYQSLLHRMLFLSAIVYHFLHDIKKCVNFDKENAITL